MNRLLAMRPMIRSPVVQQINVAVNQQIRSSSSSNSSSSDSSDSSDSDTDQAKTNNTITNDDSRREEAKKQTSSLLNSLLTKMSQDKLVTKTVDFAVPPKKPFLKKEKVLTLEENIEVAAKNVAQSLGGDVEKKEKDLLDKVFSAGTAVPEMNVTDNTNQAPAKSLNELLSGMKIDKTKKPSAPLDAIPFSRSAKIQELARRFQNLRSHDGAMNQRRRPQIDENEQVANLFQGQRLGIFKAEAKKSPDTPAMPIWDSLEKKELKLLITHPPENYFQELIQWTERGLLWKFPIDNEQGLEAEHSVHFSEHVFMDRHLKSWCPKKGPIRHFMELVCVGLSKNPYMTVEEKKEHIFWFRDYFGLNQDLLKELNAIQEDIPVEAPEEQKLFAITPS